MTVSSLRIHRIAILMVLAIAVVLLLAAAFAACGDGHSATDDDSGLPPEGPFFELMNLIPLNEDSRAFVSDSQSWLENRKLSPMVYSDTGCGRDQDCGSQLICRLPHEECGPEIGGFRQAMRAWETAA